MNVTDIDTAHTKVCFQWQRFAFLAQPFVGPDQSPGTGVWMFRSPLTR